MRAHVKKIGWLAAIITLLLLAATGKLNVLFAMLGLTIAFLARLAPAILHYAPQLHRLWELYVNGTRNQNRTGSDSSGWGDAAMSRAEALAVLGLKPGASSEDIVQAHRKLISRLHPDRGGSDYLAARINLAKKTLLGN